MRAAASLGDTEIVVIDPLADYTAVMEELFDFDALRALFQAAFACSSMPCMQSPDLTRSHILEELLGAPPAR